MKQDVLRARCAWRRAQPCECADLEAIPQLQQRIELKPLLVGQLRRENLKQLAFGTHDDFGAKPLQHSQPWNDNGSPPQFVDPGPDQDDATIGL